MNNKRSHQSITYFIASVWMINGLICKVLNLVPRHEQIVAKILGTQFSGALTTAIGLAEIGMAIWIITGIKHRLNAFMQITLVLTMNILEFIIVPDLLLWGKANSVFAIMFAFLIFYNEYILNPKISQQT